MGRAVGPVGGKPGRVWSGVSRASKEEEIVWIGAGCPSLNVLGWRKLIHLEEAESEGMGVVGQKRGWGVPGPEESLQRSWV